MWKIAGCLVRITVHLGTTVQSSSALAEYLNFKDGGTTIVVMNHADTWYHQAKDPHNDMSLILGTVAEDAARTAEKILLAMHTD